jgi:hypothetical protein
MTYPAALHRLRLRTKNPQAFAIVESLVAAVVSAFILTGSIAILNRQIEFAAKGHALEQARNVINQDIKSIRQYASLWGLERNANVFDPLSPAQEFPEAMTYVSSPACRSFTRRGSLESFARSDIPVLYPTWFPYASQIWQNNGLVSSIPMSPSTSFEVRRRYSAPTNSSSTQAGTSSIPEDELPLTLRITYTVRTVTNNNGQTTREDTLQQTADVNFFAQYAC